MDEARIGFPTRDELYIYLLTRTCRSLRRRAAKASSCEWDDVDAADEDLVFLSTAAASFSTVFSRYRLRRCSFFLACAAAAAASSAATAATAAAATDCC